MHINQHELFRIIAETSDVTYTKKERKRSGRVFDQENYFLTIVGPPP